MNRNQRFKNRAEAEKLAAIATSKQRANHVCANCKEKDPGAAHWVQTHRATLENVVAGVPLGYYTCDHDRASA